MTACETLRPLLAARPLGVLDADEEARIDDHLAACAECPSFAQELEDVLELTVPRAQETLSAKDGAQAERSWDVIERDLRSAKHEADAAERLNVRVSLSCSFCHDALTRSEAVFCASCLAPHHGECFAEHGRCSALGCEEREVVRPGRPQAPRSSERWGRRTLLTVLGSGAVAAVVASSLVGAWSITQRGLEGSAAPAPAPRVTVEAAPLPAPREIDADEIVRTAQAMDERKAAAQYLLAHATRLIALDRHREGVRLLDLALRMDRSLVSAMTLRGVAHVELGETVRALADFDQALALDPSRPRTLRWRARVHLLAGRHEAAVSDLSQAIALDPQNHELWFERGKARAEAGDHQGALDDLDRVIALRPGLASPYVFRALGARKLGRVEAAIADLNRALELEPNNPDAFRERGLILASQGKLEAALADLDRSIALDATNAHAVYGRAQIRHETGDLKGGLLDLARTLVLDPRRSDVQRELERWIQEDGAARALDEAWRAAPDNPHLHWARARRYTQDDDLHEAARAYRRTIRLDPKMGAAHAELGRVSMGLDDFAAAYAAFGRAIELLPAQASLYGERGQAALKLGRREQALADLGRATELEPDAPRWWSLLGDAQRAAQRFPQAHESYARALAVAPGHLQALLGRGGLREARDDLEGALDDYAEAIRAHPKAPLAYRARGTVLHALGRLDEARSDLRRYQVLLHGSDAKVQRLLAEIERQRAARDPEATPEPFRINPPGLSGLRRGEEVVVILRDGARIEGEVLEVRANALRVQTARVGFVTLLFDQIKRVERPRANPDAGTQDPKGRR